MIVRGPASITRLTLDVRNLGAFDAEAGHQALLVKYEGVGIFFHRRRSQVLRNAVIHDNDGRADADFPALRLVEIFRCPVVHQEYNVAVGLGASLPTPRSRD